MTDPAEAESAPGCGEPSPEDPGLAASGPPDSTYSSEPDAIGGAEDAAPGAAGGEDAVQVALEDALARLGAEVAGVRALLEERLRYDATKEEAFRRLYEDLEQFRGEASFVQTRPLYLDLLLLLDRLRAGVEPWKERSPEIAGFLISLEDEVEEILARRGILPLEAGGVSFDPALHRAIQVEETGDPEEHNSIARVVRRGYEWNGRLLRAQEVIVRRFPDYRRAR